MSSVLDPAALALPAAAAPSEAGPWRRAWRRLKRRPSALLGLAESGFGLVNGFLRQVAEEFFKGQHAGGAAEDVVADFGFNYTSTETFIISVMALLIAGASK